MFLPVCFPCRNLPWSQAPRVSNTMGEINAYWLHIDSYISLSLTTVVEPGPRGGILRGLLFCLGTLISHLGTVIALWEPWPVWESWYFGLSRWSIWERIFCTFPHVLVFFPKFTLVRWESAITLDPLKTPPGVPYLIGIVPGWKTEILPKLQIKNMRHAKNGVFWLI